ncbi:MAG: hypothetical protein ACXVB1_10885 [Pseudobdellovibrionaceae bacterium]
MKNVLINFSMLLSISVAHAGTTDCFNNPNLHERTEMLSEFHNHHYEEFDKKFHALCEKYSSNLICTVDSVEKSKSDTKMQAILSHGRCTEAMKVDSGKNTKVYSINDKNN